MRGLYLLTVVIALVAAAWCWQHSQRIDAHAVATGTWPTAAGKIVAARIDRLRPDNDAVGVQHHVRLRYRYEAGGRQHTGSAIYDHADASFSDEASAEAFLRRHAVGTALDVYYDPAAPGTSVLYPGMTGEGGAFRAIAGMLGVVALVSLIKAVLAGNRRA